MGMITDLLAFDRRCTAAPGRNGASAQALPRQADGGRMNCGAGHGAVAVQRLHGHGHLCGAPLACMCKTGAIDGGPAQTQCVHSTMCATRLLICGSNGRDHSTQGLWQQLPGIKSA